MNVADVVARSPLMVVCGSGGVGKTTTSAALALMVAESTDKRVLVMTIDPARRLADVLGLDGPSNAAVAIDNVKGHLSALVLDTKTGWDQLVRRHAPADLIEPILANPLYKHIAGSFVQSHDYIAMEQLYQLHNSGEWDAIVIDTPPSAHAVDFLDAPTRMASFFDSRLLQFLVAPTKVSFTGMTTKVFVQLADRTLGRRFVSDIAELFSMLQTMRPGFIERARHVEALLRSDQCSFAVVTTPAPSPSKAARQIIGQITSRQMTLGAVVVNRVLPHEALDTSLTTNPAALEEELEALCEPGVSAGRVADAVLANFGRLSTLAQAEDRYVQELFTNDVARAKVPWFGHELDHLDGLRRLGKSIWRQDEENS